MGVYSSSIAGPGPLAGPAEKAEGKENAMLVVSLRRLLIAGAAVLAASVTAVPAQAAAPGARPGPAHVFVKPSGKSTAHPLRPAGFKGAGAPSRAASPAAGKAPTALTNGSGQLTYNGGFVQTAPRIFLDFWGDWSTGNQPAGMSYVTTFVDDLAGSAYLTTGTQYCEADRTNIPDGSTIAACGGNSRAGVPGRLAGSFNDTANAAPTATSNELAISNEADAARAHFGVTAGDQNSLIIVLPPSGLSNFDVPEVGPACGFHDWDLTTSGTLQTVFAYIPWAPDEGAACATNAVNAGSAGLLDGMSIVTGHEIAEAITDPLVGAVLSGSGQTFFGWTDAAGFENADKCQGLTTWPARNVAFGAATFPVQPAWTDAGATCAMEGLGGVSNAHAAVAVQTASQRDAFVRGTDGAVWWQSFAGGRWSGWSSLGGFTANGPGAVAWGANRLDLFVRGSDNALWHRPWTNTTGWGGWQPLGGILISGPAVASIQVNNLDVVAVGRDNALWHIQWNGSTWGSWESLGGIITTDPGAIATSGRLDVFGRGNDLAMWHRVRTGTTWGAWESLGGGFGTGPSAVSPTPGQPQVYAIGLDSAIWRDSFNGTTWSGWTSLEGSWQLAPAAIATSAGVEIFDVGSDGSTDRLLLGT